MAGPVTGDSNGTIPATPNRIRPRYSWLRGAGDSRRRRPRPGRDGRIGGSRADGASDRTSFDESSWFIIEKLLRRGFGSWSPAGYEATGSVACGCFRAGVNGNLFRGRVSKGVDK